MGTSLTIKAKLILAFAVLFILMLILGIESIYTLKSLESANEAQNERVVQLKLATDFEKHMTEIVLTAMDTIIDKDEGKVSQERDETLKGHFKFLKSVSPALLEAADTE